MRLVALVGAMLLIIFALLQSEQGSKDDHLPRFDIRQVDVVGEINYGDKAEFQNYYNQLIGEGLFDRSMQELIQFAVRPEWVRSVQVRRVWPHTLRIIVTEHRPLAFWNDGQIITADGDIIKPEVTVGLPLTQLKGPADTEDTILDQFILISQMLSTSDLRVSQLVMADRGAWDITFANGVMVKLGRDKVLDRLQRFVAVYKTDLSGRIDRIISVDARYPHGVAVKWAEED